MRIKNYTSNVPVERTVSRIEQLLAEAGAKAISKNYEGGRMVSLTFQLEIEGKVVAIRLPANPDSVYEALVKDVKRPHDGTLERLKFQSDRTAWKIQQEWLEIELTKLRLNQTEPLQAFLPYIWNGTQTYYAALKEKSFKGLLLERNPE